VTVLDAPQGRHRKFDACLPLAATAKQLGGQDCPDGRRAEPYPEVVPLGVAFYLTLAGVTGRPGVASWLLLFLTTPLGIFLGYFLFDALCSGRIAVGRGENIRADHPVRFRVWVAWFGTMNVLLLALFLYAASRLMEG
jgi:hypothetical protein